jgi:hypothetical protein
MYIFACDPGKCSGWAIYDDLGEVFSGQLEFAEFVTFADDEAKYAKPDVIVVERFTITQETAKKTQQTDALEVIGVLRYLAQREGSKFIRKQTPTEAKRFSTNDRLETLGWLKHPLAQWDHANDALRHLLLYLVNNTNEIDLRSML